MPVGYLPYAVRFPTAVNTNVHAKYSGPSGLIAREPMVQTQDALLLREAVTAAKVGNKAAARQLLRQASVHNPNNELVWLWRASLSESPKEAIFYLGEVLRINPQNQKAAAWLEKCKGQSPTTPTSVEGPKPVGQNLSQPPEPGSVPNGTPATVTAAAATATSGSTFAMPPVASATTTQSLLKTVQNVGVSAGTAPEATAATAAVANGQVTEQTVGRLVENRPKPTVIPFVATKGSAAPAMKPPPQASAPPTPQHKWKCPFCSHGSDIALKKCPACRSVTVLEDLKEVEKNEGVQERTVRDAISRYESTPAEKRSYEQNLYLALGHLNLREATAAIPYLKAATALKRNEWTLLGVLDQIQWRKVIMVVDDSLTIRKALSGILEKNDYRVVTAEDGSHALERLTETVPDLVLLDITMPWMDGYQVCKHIKEKAMTRKVPVVMLSGKDGIFDRVRGKLAGCNDYVTKPFDPDGLLKTIKKYLP